LPLTFTDLRSDPMRLLASAHPCGQTLISRVVVVVGGRWVKSSHSHPLLSSIRGGAPPEAGRRGWLCQPPGGVPRRPLVPLAGPSWPGPPGVAGLRGTRDACSVRVGEFRPAGTPLGQTFLIG